jgi:phage tail sheath gpL-like
MISFNLIPSNIRTPGTYIEIDNSRALRGLQPFATKILVLGQRRTTGSKAAGELVLVNSAEEAKTYFGAGSMLANMFDVLKKNNKYTESYAIAFDDNGAGVAASGTVTVTGTATADGTIHLYLAGVYIPVGVANSDAQNTVAASINAAINANVDLPVTSTVASNVVTVTCRHKGLMGNQIDTRLNYYGEKNGEKNVPGVTVALVQLSGGTTNPTIASTLATLPDEIYDFIVMPFTDATNMTALENELSDRWGPLRMLEGGAFSAYKDTLANLSTFGNGRNSPYMCCMGFNNSPSPAYLWAAALGGKTAFEATQDPARPFHTLELRGILPPPDADVFNIEERNILLYDGIATFKTTKAGKVLIDRLITMYQTNAVGTGDPSYLDYNTMATLSYLRQTLRSRLAQKFPRHKIADDGTRFSPGQAITTPRGIKAEIVALFTEWEAAGLVEGVEQFKTELIVERHSGDPNRVDVQLPPDLVNQLNVIAAQIQFLL